MTRGSSSSTACTIIARNYLAQARVFARSYKQHHPEHRVVVLVLDDDEYKIGPGEHFEVMRPAEIMGEREFGNMATMYSIVELATAVKPFLLRSLLGGSSPRVAYFDPDIEIFTPLDAILRLADQHGVVLTPHLLSPPPRGDGLTPNEDVVLSVGTFNLGFIVVADSAPLGWWSDRLARECIIDPRNGRFVDQRWADLLAGYSDAKILRDPGVNVAWWNLATRRVRRVNDEIRVDGEPLKFFHFSGYDPHTPWLLTKHQGPNPRVLLSEEPVLRGLTERYGALLRDVGYDTLSRIEYGLDTTPGGLPLDTRMRTVFRRALVASDLGDKTPPPDPFSTSDDAFLNFLTEADPYSSGPHRAGRYVHSLWQERDELRRRFPDVHGEDASAFTAWARGEGVSRSLVPSRLAERIDPPRDPRPFDGPVAGVHVIGPLAAAGMNGDVGRRMALALSSGLPVRVTPITRTPEDRRGSQPAWRSLGSLDASGVAFSVNLFCLPNARALEAVHLVGPWAREGSRDVGLVISDDEIPVSLDEWGHAFDELWALSRTAVAALARRTSIPVRLAPVPAIKGPSQADARRSLGAESAGFLVSIIEDFAAPIDRTNVLGAVEAFLDGIGDDESCSLVVHALNANSDRAAVEHVRYVLQEHPRAQLVTTPYASLGVAVAAADCLVSLPKNADVVLPVLDAMAAGVAVVGSACGGLLDVLDERTGWPCRIGTDGNPVGAAAALNAARNEAAERQQRAQRARELIEARHSDDTLLRFLNGVEPRTGAAPAGNSPVAH